MGGQVIGLLQPGEMGAAVGRCLVERGHTVLWASAGRSAASAARADAAGLVDAGEVVDVVRRADIILSVCPPHAALDVARRVAGSRFRGVYVDANAVSPATARAIADVVEQEGGCCVDGGIIGAPPSVSGRTRLYLAGGRAPQIRDLFTGTAVDARVVAGGVGAASAVKMAYAAWTKGTAALLLAARALARAEHVEDTLLAEWTLSRPELIERSERSAADALAKGWRWVGEMEAIASAMAVHDLPAGFHHAAAAVFRAVGGDRPVGGDRAVDAVLAALLAGDPGAGPLRREPARPGAS